MTDIAKNLSQVYRALFIQPIPMDKLDEQYVNLNRVRGDNPTRTIQRRLEEFPLGNMQIIFHGYRGCGKSTELNRLTKAIQADFLVLKYSILEESDPFSLNYVELFLVTMKKLFTLAEEQSLKLSDFYLDNITDFLNQESIEKIRDAYMGAEFSTGSELDVKVPFLARFFAKLTANAKASSSIKQKIVENIQPSLSELVENCNALITEIKNNHLSTMGKKGMLIIIEDLDKLSLDVGKKIFFDNSQIITSLNTNIIFTFPLSLKYNTDANPIKSVFDTREVLPMVKVRKKDGSIYEQGVTQLREVLAKRIDLSLFEDEKWINYLIDYSGGCLRDLFRATIDAADHALDFDKEKMGEEDVKFGVRKLKYDYEDTIAERREGNKVIVSVEEYFDALIELYNDPQKRVKNNNVVFDLRQNLCILEYNGERWCDLHPVVKVILRERKLVDQNG